MPRLLLASLLFLSRALGTERESDLGGGGGGWGVEVEGVDWYVLTGSLSTTLFGALHLLLLITDRAQSSAI